MIHSMGCRRMRIYLSMRVCVSQCCPGIVFQPKGSGSDRTNSFWNTIPIGYIVYMTVHVQRSVGILFFYTLMTQYVMCVWVSDSGYYSLVERFLPGHSEREREREKKNSSDAIQQPEKLSESFSVHCVQCVCACPIALKLSFCCVPVFLKIHIKVQYWPFILLIFSCLKSFQMKFFYYLFISLF